LLCSISMTRWCTQRYKASSTVGIKSPFTLLRAVFCGR
jgi:hypothetical protein